MLPLMWSNVIYELRVTALHSVAMPYFTLEVTSLHLKSVRYNSRTITGSKGWFGHLRRLGSWQPKQQRQNCRPFRASYAARQPAR